MTAEIDTIWNPTNNGDKRDDKGRFTNGNPGGPGRPKGISLTDLIRKEIEKIPEGEKRTRAELFVDKLLKQAERGDVQTQKLIMNYLEGLPKQPIDLGGDVNFTITRGHPLPAPSESTEDSRNAGEI